MNRIALQALLLAALSPVGATFAQTADASAQPTPASIAAPAETKRADVIPEITIDTSTAPEMAGFARIVKACCETYFGKFAEYLTTDGYQPPTQFTIIFVKDMGGVANTSGRRPPIIRCAPAYFTANPTDYGALLHEMVHVIQQYRGGAPTWLTEGITDYVRFYMYEPVANRPHPNPDTAKYTDSYRVTGCFLDWINRTYDKAFVQKLNVICRKGTYTPETWKDITGKDVDTLWSEFAAWLRTQPVPPATASQRSRPAVAAKPAGAPKTD